MEVETGGGSEIRMAFPVSPARFYIAGLAEGEHAQRASDGEGFQIVGGPVGPWETEGSEGKGNVGLGR